MAKQIEALPEVDLPDEFYQNIRHISSFKNKSEYEKYLQIEIEKFYERRNSKIKLAKNI